MRKIMDGFIVILFACNSRSYNIVTTLTSVSGKKVFDMLTSNIKGNTLKVLLIFDIVKLKSNTFDS